MIKKWINALVAICFACPICYFIGLYFLNSYTGIGFAVIIGLTVLVEEFYLIPQKQEVLNTIKNQGRFWFEH